MRVAAKDLREENCVNTLAWGRGEQVLQRWSLLAPPSYSARARESRGDSAAEPSHDGASGADLTEASAVAVKVEGHRH